MASSKEYLEFILGKLSELEEITYRAMMIYALSDFLIMIVSWLVKQSLRAFLFQEVQP